MFNLIWFAIFNSWHYLFFIACRGKTPSNSDVSTRNLYWQIWTDRSHPWVDSTTNSRIYRRIHRVFNVAGLGACSQYQLSKLQEEKRHDEVARTLTPLRLTAAPSANPLSARRPAVIFRRIWGRLKLRKLGLRKKQRSRCAPAAVWIFIKLIGLGTQTKCKYAEISLNMHKRKYAITCKSKCVEICAKYAVPNMKYAKICQWIEIQVDHDHHIAEIHYQRLKT